MGSIVSAVAEMNDSARFSGVVAAAARRSRRCADRRSTRLRRACRRPSDAVDPGVARRGAYKATRVAGAARRARREQRVAAPEAAVERRRARRRSARWPAAASVLAPAGAQLAAAAPRRPSRPPAGAAAAARPAASTSAERGGSRVASSSDSSARRHRRRRRERSGTHPGPHADNLTARPRRPPAAQEEARDSRTQVGQGPQAQGRRAAAARRLHARVHDDAEEAELGAAQGRARAHHGLDRGHRLHPGRGPQPAGALGGPRPRRPRQGPPGRALQGRSRGARRRRRLRPQEGALAVRRQEALRVRLCRAAPPLRSVRSTPIPCTARGWCSRSSTR